MASLRDVSTPALLDALDDVFFGFDDEGALEVWNKTALDVTGYDEAEMATMGPAEFFDEADHDHLSAAVDDLRNTGQAVLEADLVTASGERIPYEFKVRRVEGDDPIAFVGIGREITERREAKREREAILNRMGDGFLAVDTDWQITYVNEKGRRILGNAMGRDPAETTFEGLHLWEEIPDAVDTTFYEEYTRAMETGDPVSFEEYFSPLDTWFDVRAFPSETGLSVYFYDITDQHRQHEELKHREEVLKELYSITAERDTPFTEQVEKLLALGRAELGTEYGSLSEIRGEEYRFAVVDADDDSMQAGDVVALDATNCEVTATEKETLVLGDVARDAPELTDREGYTDWGVSCYIGAPVFDDDGVYGTFCFYDTTALSGQFSEWEVTLVDLMSRWVSYELQRKQITEQLRRQNDRLEEFAGIVSHDLRNPLNVLAGRLELAEETGDPEQFAACYDAVERMETLIDDLLSLSKAGSSIDETESVTLSAAADGAWKTVVTADMELAIDSDRSLTADPLRLQQLLENLFRNAGEHGGSDATVTVGTLDDGFYVEDDGPGIPPEVRETVFESGYTTNPDGTGFGLAIVAEIANAHGWHIEATEGEAGGARFEITGVDSR